MKLTISGTAYEALEAWMSDFQSDNAFRFPEPQCRRFGARGRQYTFDLSDELYRHTVWALEQRRGFHADIDDPENAAEDRRIARAIARDLDRIDGAADIIEHVWTARHEDADNYYRRLKASLASMQPPTSQKAPGQ